MVSFTIASSLFLLATAPNSAVGNANASSDNHHSEDAGPLLDISPSELMGDFNNLSSICDKKESRSTSTEAICTLLNCVDTQDGSFTCYYSIVAEAFKKIPDAYVALAVESLGLSEELVNKILSCSPAEVSTIGFMQCMLSCDETPDDSVCEILECIDPLSGDFTCACDLVVNAFEKVDVADEAVQGLGITPEMVGAAVDCCPDESVLDVFNQCFNAIGNGPLLPGIDEEAFEESPATEKPPQHEGINSTQPDSTAATKPTLPLAQGEDADSDSVGTEANKPTQSSTQKTGDDSEAATATQTDTQPTSFGLEFSADADSDGAATAKPVPSSVKSGDYNSVTAVWWCQIPMAMAATMFMLILG